MNLRTRVAVVPPWIVVIALLMVQAAEIPGALVENPVRLDRIHVDLAFPYVNGAWDVHIHAALPGGDLSLQPHEALLIADASAVVQRPFSPAFDFLGVPPGAPVWLMSQTGDIGLYLGFEALYDAARVRRMTQSSVQEWDHDGRGFAPPQLVVEISMVGMRGPGYFSAWFSYPEGPDLFFATSDGISLLEPISLGDDLDEFPQFVGGHSHVNWAFTAPGRYELDLQARTVLADGSEAVSSVTTLYFEVEQVPEPSAGILLLGMAGLCSALHRFRCRPSDIADQPQEERTLAR